MVDGPLIGVSVGFGITGLIVVGLLILIIPDVIRRRIASSQGLDFTELNKSSQEIKDQINARVREGVDQFFKAIRDSLISFIGLASVLMSDAIFLAGPIIDMVNQSYKYSIASVVGFINTALVGFFGSTTFADMSAMIVGWVGLPGPDANRGWSDWLFSMGSNWKLWLYMIPLFGLAIAPAGLLSVSNLLASKVAYGIGFAAIIFYLLVPLAGSGYLGILTTNGPTFGPNPANPVLGGGIKVDQEPYGYCDLPGFSWAEGRIAPASVVLSQTILWCHLIEMWNTQDSNWIATFVTAMVIFISQYVTLSAKTCLRGYPSGNYAPFVGLFISMGTAYLAYTGLTFMKEGFTTQTDSKGIFHNPQPVAPTKKTDGEKLSTKIVVGPPEDTSEPVDDQDAFVCEAYKDGELVTSTLVE